MAQTFQRVGCTDPHASNYDPTATVLCDNCCEYISIGSPRIIEGCTDKLATNFNKIATVSCRDCCNYDKPTRPTILYQEEPYKPPQEYAAFAPYVGTPDVPPYPYNVNSKEGAYMCIRDSGFEERGWISDAGTYSNGYFLYKELLTQNWPTTTPNWDTNGSLSQIWAAFDRLLENKPNSRVFFNTSDYVPWIIPLYSDDNPLTTNPNQSRFKSDCDLAGGTIYTFEEGGQTINLQTELDQTQKSLNEANNELADYQDYLRSLKREPTTEELYTLNQLKDTQKSLSIEVGDIQNQIKAGGTSTIVNDSYVRNHFMACLCELATDVPPTDTCTTQIVIPGEIPRTVTDIITKEAARCIKDFESYKTFLENQVTYQGWAGTQTSFYNTALFQSMGISLDDAKFIVINLLNTGQAYYPHNQTVTTVPNGRSTAINILKNAFNKGANFWVPADPIIGGATDIIHRKECCDIVGGLFQEGNYDPSRVKPNEPERTGPYGHSVNTGVCLCNEIKPPCPTLNSGEIDIITVPLETGGQLTWVKVPEECCSNEALQSRMKGNWVWDGRRCILEQKDDSNACEDATVITINETPINIKDVDCEGDYVTISAYMYFEAPDNRCTNGVLVSDTSDKLTDEFLGLLRNQPETTTEIMELARFDLGSYGTSNAPSDQPQNPQQPQNSNCCYDTEVPIQAQLVIQDQHFTILQATSIEYIDTFQSTQTNINTNENVGQGFNVWVKLTTTASTTDLLNLTNGTFNIAVEFTQGLFKCCNYDIYFDDIEVGCLQPGFKERYYTEPCVGFDLGSCVIDNKKSWVYNPGTQQMSDTVYDNMVRNNGTLGMNKELTGIVRAGGHGAINRVFAPSVDAELDFRDTDYFNFHGVIERHSKLVLNTKHLIVQFNMCPDNDCVLGSYGYLTDDDGSYILDDDGGRIIVQDEVVPFPNLVQLEQFKKTFQNFWVQIIEQFIPATTIFVSGEKWCNNRICDEKVVADYLLDSRADDLSPAPVSQNVTQPTSPTPPNTASQSQALIRTTSNDPNNTPTGGQKSSTNTNPPNSPIRVGNYAVYGTDNLDPDLGNTVIQTKRSAV